MKKFFILLGMVLLMSAISCTQRDKNGLPPSTGPMSEVLVVLPNQDWDGNLGDVLKDLFSSAQYGLNQAEPMFDLMQISHTEFKGLFERYRKILKIFVSDTVKTDQVIARNDIFSAPQVMVEIHAKTEDGAIELLRSRYISIAEMFKGVERERISKAYAQTENLKLRQDMIDQFGFYFIMPESYYNAKQNTDFAWYRLEHSRYSQCLLVYVREFVDSAQFSPNNLVMYRNKVCMENVPGELPGSYMSTDTVYFPDSRLIDFSGTPAVEMRGLWRTEGDFMGGPFLNYSFLDKTGKKVITLEGYVYYPNEDKRDLLMQLESILYSFTYNK